MARAQGGHHLRRNRLAAEARIVHNNAALRRANGDAPAIRADGQARERRLGSDLVATEQPKEMTKRHTVGNTKNTHCIKARVPRG